LQEKLNIVNIRQAIQDADCEIGIDYVVISKKDFPNVYKDIARQWNLRTNFNKVQQLTFVYESGVYKVLNNTKSQAGKDFNNWLFRDVLPTIRETGRYEIPNFESMMDITINPNQLIQNTKRDVQLTNSKGINLKNYEEKGLR
jgi:prophage antirepressor-like protein